MPARLPRRFEHADAVFGTGAAVSAGFFADAAVVAIVAVDFRVGGVGGWEAVGMDMA